MTRDELAVHMIFTHDIPRESVENRSTDDLMEDHFTDHQSVISQAKGLSSHRNSIEIASRIPAERPYSAGL